MSTTLSCAQCGATLRSDQGWCSLCYATVEAGFDPLTAPLDEVVQRDAPAVLEPPVEPIVEPEVGPALETIDARDQPPLVPEVAAPASDAEPRSAALVSPTSGEGIDDVAVMLSMLAAEHRQNDRTSALVDRMDDKGTRLVVMFGGAALIALLVFLGLTALGLIF